VCAGRWACHAADECARGIGRWCGRRYRSRSGSPTTLSGRMGLMTGPQKWRQQKRCRQRQRRQQRIFDTHFLRLVPSLASLLHRDPSLPRASSPPAAAVTAAYRAPRAPRGANKPHLARPSIHGLVLESTQPPLPPTPWHHSYCLRPGHCLSNSHVAQRLQVPR